MSKYDKPIIKVKTTYGHYFLESLKIINNEIAVGYFCGDTYTIPREYIISIESTSLMSV